MKTTQDNTEKYNVLINGVNIQPGVVKKLLDSCLSQETPYLAEFITTAFNDEEIEAMWQGLLFGLFELSDAQTHAFYFLRGG